MSTLAEIEIAADALPPEEKQELILFLATRLRGSGVKLPPPRKFSKEQLASWIADDEAEMMRFKKGASGRPSLFGLLDQRFSGNA